MSGEIYYDRAFLRVGELYSPVVCHGSNNTWGHNFFIGRMYRERNWHVMNWKRHDRLLFTEQEIRELAHDYDLYNQDSGISGPS